MKVCYINMKVRITHHSPVYRNVNWEHFQA